VLHSIGCLLSLRMEQSLANPHLVRRRLCIRHCTHRETYRPLPRTLLQFVRCAGIVDRRGGFGLCSGLHRSTVRIPGDSRQETPVWRLRNRRPCLHFLRSARRSVRLVRRSAPGRVADRFPIGTTQRNRQHRLGNLPQMYRSYRNRR